jgi:hypothetical protein
MVSTFKYPIPGGERSEIFGNICEGAVQYIVDYLSLTLPAPARLLGGTPLEILPSPSHLRRLVEEEGWGTPYIYILLDWQGKTL